MPSEIAVLFLQLYFLNFHISSHEMYFTAAGCPAGNVIVVL